MIPTPPSLSERAVLASISVRIWAARKTDRSATHETLTAHSAHTGAGSFSKRLLPKEALGALQSQANRLRHIHEIFTLPWTDSARILPAPSVPEYLRTMGAHITTFDNLVCELVSEYQAHIETAKLALGTLYNAADYPPATEVAEKFRASVSISPVPDASDFRVDISEDVRKDLEARLQADLTASHQAAMDDLAATIDDLMTKLDQQTRDGSAPHHSTRRAMDSAADKLKRFEPILGAPAQALSSALSQSLSQTGGW